MSTPIDYIVIYI